MSGAEEVVGYLDPLPTGTEIDVIILIKKICDKIIFSIPSLADSWENSLIDDELEKDHLLDEEDSKSTDINEIFDMVANAVTEAVVDSLDFVNIGGQASEVSRNLYSTAKKEASKEVKKEIVKDTVSEITGEVIKNAVEDILKESKEIKNTPTENSSDAKFDRINPKIHKDRQDKHIEGTKNYKQQINNEKNPSILTEDPDKLLKERIGKIEYSTINKDIVDYGRIIGKFYDATSNKYYDTTRATIHYDTKGNAHIVPAMPKWLLEK